MEVVFNSSGFWLSSHRLVGYLNGTLAGRRMMYLVANELYLVYISRHLSGKASRQAGIDALKADRKECENGCLFNTTVRLGWKVREINALAMLFSPQLSSQTSDFFISIYIIADRRPKL